MERPLGHRLAERDAPRRPTGLLHPCQLSLARRRAWRDSHSAATTRPKRPRLSATDSRGAMRWRARCSERPRKLQLWEGDQPSGSPIAKRCGGFRPPAFALAVAPAEPSAREAAQRRDVHSRLPHNCRLSPRRARARRASRSATKARPIHPKEACFLPQWRIHARSREAPGGPNPAARRGVPQRAAAARSSTASPRRSKSSRSL